MGIRLLWPGNIYPRQAWTMVEKYLCNLLKQENDCLILLCVFLIFLQKTKNIKLEKAAS